MARPTDGREEVMSDYNYHQVQGGRALKACQAFETLAQERFKARKALAEKQGAVAAVKIKDHWGLYFEGQPGPGWMLVAASGSHSVYLPDSATPEGRAYLAELAKNSPPDSADLAELLGWLRDDPRRPVVHSVPGLGRVIVTPFIHDPALPPVPGAVRRIDEGEYDAGRRRPEERRKAS